MSLRLRAVVAPLPSPSAGRPSWLRWLLRGSRRGFEVVVLDHGTYVDVEEQLRQQFCQLWCAVIMRDEATQVGQGSVFLALTLV